MDEYETTTLPFAYEVEVRLPRKRPFAAFVREDAPFALRSVSAEEAPVALRVRRYGKQPYDVRRHEGRDYRAPSLRPGQGSVGLADLPKTPALGAPGAPPYANGIRTAEARAAFDEGMHGLAAGSARIAAPNREARLAEASAIYAHGVLMVAGTPWMSCDDQVPYWSVQDAHGRVSVELLFGTPKGEGQPFGVGRRDDAVAFAEAVARDGRVVFVTPDTVEVFVPASYDERVATAHAACADLGSSKVFDYPDGLDRACMRLYSMSRREDVGDARWAEEVIAEALSYRASAAARTGLHGEAGDFARRLALLAARTDMDPALARADEDEDAFLLGPT